MSRFQLYIILFFISFSLFGCFSDSQKGQKIPPVPEISAKIRRDAAIAFLTEAINLSPNSPDNYYKRALLNLEGQNFKNAIEDIENAIGLKANQGKYFQVKGMILREMGKPQDALTSALNAEVLNDESAELFTLLGDLYQQVRQFSRAKIYLNKSLQISPNNGETYYYQGLVAAKLADTTTALRFYEQALALKPTFLPIYTRMIETHTALKAYDVALLYCTEGLKHFPQSGELYFQQGQTYQRSWKLDSAIQSYAKAIKFEPKLIKASFNAGGIYFRSRAYRLALPLFEHTYKQNPAYPEVKQYMALCLEYTGELEKAEEFYSTLIAENAQDYRALNGLWRVKRKLLYGDASIPDYSEVQDSILVKPKNETARKIDTTISLRSIQAIQPRTRSSYKTDTFERKLPQSLIKN
jgi:tetratricopeptide (TPR) repeat protein